MNDIRYAMLHAVIKTQKTKGIKKIVKTLTKNKDYQKVLINI